MGNKRKIENQDEKIRKKIRRLEGKLNKKPSRRRVILSSSSSEDESSCSHVASTSDHEERVGTASRYASLALAPPAPSPPAPSPPEPTQPEPEQPPPETPHEPVLATVTTETGEDLELGDEILSLLGEPPKTKTTFGKNIHKQVASRWQELLCNGLSKDVKDTICQQYLVPANCDLLVAPVLNPETKAALTDFVIKRDISLQHKQDQIGTVLAALSQAMELSIRKESAENILKPLSDACRLLCDVHYLDTKARRQFVISTVKPELRDALTNTTRNRLLFGENLNEQIKSAKDVQKTAEGLKVTHKRNTFDRNRFIKNINQHKSNLNYKGSYHKTVPPGRAEVPQPQQVRRAARSRPPAAPQHGHHRARERSPPRRACRK